MPRNCMNSLGTGLILLAVTLGTGSASAQTESEATAAWRAPTFGTPVAHYLVQLSVNEGDWATIATPVDTVCTLIVTEGNSHRVRVAGVDAEERQGPFSQPSAVYIPGVSDLGEPGSPGRPRWPPVRLIAHCRMCKSTGKGRPFATPTRV